MVVKRLNIGGAVRTSIPQVPSWRVREQLLLLYNVTSFHEETLWICRCKIYRMYFYTSLEGPNNLC